MECRDSEGWQAISRERPFDFTLCFHEGVFASAFLCLLLVFALAQSLFLYTNAARQLSRKSKLALQVKVFTLLSATLLSFVNLGLIREHNYHVPVPGFYILEPLSLLSTILLTFFNHTRTRRSSTVLLLFWLLYPIVLGLWTRSVIHAHMIPELRTVLALRWSIVGLGLVGFALECISPDVGNKKGVSTTENGHPKAELHVEHPTLTANVFSIWFFHWLTPLMRRGASHYISEDDLPSLPASDEAPHLGHKLEVALATRILWKALLVVHGPSFAGALLLGLSANLIRFLQPQLLQWLLSFISKYQATSPTSLNLRAGQGTGPSSFEGFFIAATMFFASVASTVLYQQEQQRILETGMRVRVGVVTAIYQKALVLSNDKHEWTSGAIVNLMSADAARLEAFCEFLPVGIYIPFQVALAFVLLYNLLGWPCFIGIAILILSTTANSFSARVLQKMQQSLMKTRDRRINLMKELLNIIKSIKLYAWEYTFLDRISKVRNFQEMKILRNFNLFLTFTTVLWVAVPLLVGLTSLATAAAVSNKPLTPDIIFPSIALFTMLQYPTTIFPQFISQLIQALVSLRRIQSFLAAAELSSEARKLLLDARSQDGTSSVLSIKHADFSWSSQDVAPSLEDITLEVEKGQLIGVLGQVGEGKSSLLNAIIGEMNKREGKLVIRGSVAYAAQDAWIQSSSVRDNILFGHVYEDAFYDSVLEACALKPDLAILKQGDMTLVGEKGVTLSGGQRARIALARATYARADLTLLDDCLAAVDSHVAKHIFDNVIGPNGLLASKARILVTNSVAFLQDFDKLVYLRRGIILESGSYGDLFNLTEGNLRKLVETREKDGNVSSSPESPASSTDTSSHSSSNGDKALASKKFQDRLLIANKLDRAKLAVIPSTRVQDQTDLTQEHSEQGRVQVSVYIRYMRACSSSAFILAVLVTLAWQASAVMGNFVLRAWTNHNEATGSNEGYGWYLTIYAVLCLIGVVFSTIGVWLMWVVCGLRGARYLHDSMVEALLRAPMSYFELTPTGRTLNLFSQDLNVVDQNMSRLVSNSLRTFVLNLGSIVVVATGFPAFLIAVFPLAWFYAHVVNYFLRTSRELKRLEATTKSPIFSWFSESISGLSTIRAFGLQDVFTLQLQRRIDRNQIVYLPGISIRRWLAIRLELIGSTIILIAAMLAVTFLVTTGIDSGLVGMVLSYAITTTGWLNMFVSSISQVEQSMVSVERILHETEVKPEAPQEIPSMQPLEDWPSKGAIEFRSYSTRYRPDLDLVLRDVSATFAPGEKVGIIGRTGSGKSTLLLSLFRIIEPVNGTVLIDEVDIGKIGLHDLRSRLSIVPQFPDLFEGTLRENIDPLAVHPDVEIWSSLEHVHLKDLVESLPGKLDAPVKEGGTSLSAGQRQLLCFARALLRKSKVLVLDEATSAIDLETDRKIQQVIRGEVFQEVTILTIAHRLNTIMDSDRVLVMDSGKIAEFDTPEKLLKNQTSLFFSLAESARLAKRDDV